MIPTLIPNPMWLALTTRNQSLGIGDVSARRFRAEIAPFVAVPDASVPAAAVRALLSPGEVVYIMDQRPADLDGEPAGGVLQMEAAQHIRAPPDAVVHLDDSDTADMLALTAIAYPFFFRAQTQRFGRYVGIRVDGRLVAMAGERMAVPGAQEISAICTHPEHVGQGYAAMLTQHIAAAIQARGERAFLHVSSANTRAIALYARLGFATTAEFALLRVTGT